MFGTLQIVITQDIGDLGPSTGSVIEYEWPLYWHLAGLVPFIIVLGLLFLPTNRNRHGWLALLALIGSAAIIYMPSKVLELIGWAPPLDGINAFLGGVAALWLLGGVIGRIKRLPAMAFALGVMAAFSLIETLLRGHRDMTLVYMAVASLVPVFVLVVTAFWCRRRYSRGRFIGLLIVSCLLVVLLIILTISIILILSMGWFFSGVWISLLIGAPIASGIMGALLFLLLLPFVMLSFYNAFYRQRFMRALRLGVRWETDGEPYENEYVATGESAENP